MAVRRAHSPQLLLALTHLLVQRGWLESDSLQVARQWPNGPFAVTATAGAEPVLDLLLEAKLGRRREGVHWMLDASDVEVLCGAGFCP
jgi:hypothetical protein